MELSDFDYHLPPDLIAQMPPERRDAARLMVVDGFTCLDRSISHMLDLIHSDDLVVLNNTRVVKARLFGSKDTGGAAELLLERLLDEHTALFQVRVSKALQPGRSIFVGDDHLQVLGREGMFYRLQSARDIAELLQEHGQVPLPPYIERQADDADEGRYQTVFAKTPGAVAAPTAGLHLTDDMLAAISAHARVAYVTLHVGSGTFQPVRTDLAQHKMHAEWFDVPQETVDEIQACRQRGGRVIAVGTTVVRTLESMAAQCQTLKATRGDTALFIKPGYEFKLVDALLTNFHLPCSTLLMLVSAFAGYDTIMSAYRTAVERRYRFFSYGDAMWLQRAQATGEVSGC